jgi:hypothetical protein
MFRVEFYVDDKNLGEAFKRLAGLAKNINHNYVPNIESKANGKLHTAAVDTQELFVNEMKKRKLTQVNANAAREIMGSLGFSPSSYSYMLQGLLKAGHVKKSGTPQKFIYTLKTEK